MRLTFFRNTFLLVILLIAGVAHGSETVTLPLEGYYHPGRYMPVHVIADTPGGGPNAVVVRAEEAVWATVNSKVGEKIDAVVPVMLVRPDNSNLWWGWLQQRGRPVWPALHPLTERQKLVGVAEGIIDPRDAGRVSASLFPGCESIYENLNPAQPLPGAPACWETMDLIALDRASVERIGEQRLSTLVAAGVAFAVRAPTPPWPHWPWKQSVEGWWVLHHVPVGPPDATYNAEVYTPVSSFVGGWPAEMRLRYALYAVGFTLVMLLLALVRPRFILVWAVLITGGVTVFIVNFHQWERPMRVAEGRVRAIGGEITQDDDWAYFTAPDLTFSRNRWADTMHIIPAAPGILSQMEPRVECLSNGDLDSLAFNVLPHAKVAVLCRRCGPQPPVITPTPSNHSPLERMVKGVYLKPGGEILGELSSAPLISEGYYHVEQWPSVVIRQKD